MATSTVSATIEELDAALSDGTYDWCQLIWGPGFQLTFTVWGHGGTILLRLRGFPCPRRAAAVLAVTCSTHGTVARAVCAKHLRAIREHPDLIVCHDCGTRISVSGGGM